MKPWVGDGQLATTRDAMRHQIGMWKELGGEHVDGARREGEQANGARRQGEQVDGALGTNMWAGWSSFRPK